MESLASIYTFVTGFTALCSVDCGRFTSSPVGNTKVDVTMKKMSNRKITSVIDAIEKLSIILFCCLNTAVYG